MTKIQSNLDAKRATPIKAIPPQNSRWRNLIN